MGCKRSSKTKISLNNYSFVFNVEVNLSQKAAIFFLIQQTKEMLFWLTLMFIASKTKVIPIELKFFQLKIK
jgi:hypothetical protein